MPNYPNVLGGPDDLVRPSCANDPNGPGGAGSTYLISTIGPYGPLG